MPTFERLPRFVRDYEHLSPTEQHAFKDTVRKFVDDLVAGGGFRKALRVRGVQGARGVFEMTWAEDGRATFQYGDARAGHEGEPHIVWRRVGTHDVFSAP